MTSRTGYLVGTLSLALVPAVAAAQPARQGAATAAAPPALVEGRPVDSRPTEKPDNTPEFAEQTRAPYRATKPYTVTTLVDGITAPWGLAFLPGGNILITERLPGKMRLRHADGRLSAPLDGLEVLKSPDAADIGLLDVVLDPAFATNHRIFFTFYDYVGGTNSNTCVARARLDDAALRLTDVTVIFRAQPRIPSKRLGGKTGGRLVFGSDGNLFLTIGDRSDSPPWDVAQRLDTHLGKVLRITPDGAPAPDNPFIGKAGVLPEIWAYGSRNAEGLALDPRTGRLWADEHGPRGGDELNVIERGRNYGWPLVAHGIDYPGTPIGDGLTHRDGLQDPVYYWDPVIAPSGLAFYTGTLFPDWKNSLFVGGLRSMTLVRLKIVNDKVVEEEPLLAELRRRIRDVRVGPDGAVYVLTDSGGSSVTTNTPPTSTLLKLTPKTSVTSVAARESRGTPAARSAFDRGEAAAEAGKLDEAVTAFRKAIAADPDYVAAHERLIDVAQRQQLQEAQSPILPRLKREYEQWARQHPTRAVYQVALGLLTKDPDQADACYDKALAIDPSSASAHFLLARNAETRGDWDSQRQHLKAAVANDPDDPRYLLRYAVAHLKSEPDRFRELALQVVARFPASPSAAEALSTLAEASSTSDRRSYLDRLRTSYPVARFRSAASAMSLLYADLTEPSEALALAREMAAALPAAAFWRQRVAAQEAMTRAKALIGSGQFDEALALLEQTPPQAGNHGTTMTLLKADAAAGGGNRPRAYATLVESAAASPDARVDAALAKLAADLGKTSRDVDADVWSRRDARATPAAAFTLTSLRDGAPVRLADFRGRVVLLAFWYPT